MSDQPVISVILPTIRPTHIARTLANLRAAAQFVPTEIIVIADFPAPSCEPHSPWYVRQRQGVIDAIALGERVARGEYLFVTNDETTLEPDCLHQLYQAAVARPGRLLTPNHQPPFPFVYYGKPFAAFPFAHRDLIQQLGGLLDPAYRAFYADPDLSMRAHAAGVPVEQVDTAVMYHWNQHDAAHHAAVAAYLDGDRATFRSRWDHLGAFRDP
jgi:hypothetical protein